MEDKLVDILHADIVLLGVSLLRQEDQRNEFAQEIEAEVVTLEVGQGLPGAGMPPIQTTISIERDRTTISVVPGRTIIRRDYPSHLHVEEDLGRLAHIITTAIRHTDWSGQQVIGLGYNMSCVFNPNLTEPAVQYIGRKFVRPHFASGLAGASVRLHIIDNGRQLTFDVQPRPDNDVQARNVYVGLNMHSTSTSFPKPDDIITALLDLKALIVNFMAKVDGTDK